MVQASGLDLAGEDGGVDTPAPQQFVVTPALDDPAAVEHEDLVGMVNRGRAVRDDEGRPVPAEQAHGLADGAFG
jgi:hypothetical protein